MKPLLTRYQRLCLIEYLMAKNNRHFQKEVYGTLMFDIQTDHQMYQRFVSRIRPFDATDQPSLQQQTDMKVERFVQTYKLYNDREYLQVKISIDEHGTLHVTPGQLLLMFSRGESDHDFFEYHKYSDEELKQAALPYYVPDRDQPVTRQEADCNLDYLVVAWQTQFQMNAFNALNSEIKKAAEQFRFESSSQLFAQHLDQIVQDLFGKWVENHRQSLPAQHNFAVRAVLEKELVIWYNSDFELLRTGRHPLNFVHIDRRHWTDSMLRSAAHRERVQEARNNV